MKAPPKQNVASQRPRPAIRNGAVKTTKVDTAIQRSRRARRHLRQALMRASAAYLDAEQTCAKISLGDKAPRPLVEIGQLREPRTAPQLGIDALVHQRALPTALPAPTESREMADALMRSLHALQSLEEALADVAEVQALRKKA